jgi:hypothetical protein
VRDLHSSSLGVTAQTPRGDVEIRDAVAFRDQFGDVAKPNGAGVSLRGLRLSVPDLGTLEDALRAGGVSSHRQAGRVVVSPSAAFGANLIFEKRG